MDELEISGKRYISTKRLARENKYHPDYMGQLIRAGKISGTKVGRAWYVDEASFAEYLGKERGGVTESVQVDPEPAQEPTSPQRGEFSAENSPTSGAVAPAYISAEVVPASSHAEIVESPYVLEKIVSVSDDDQISRMPQQNSSAVRENRSGSFAQAPSIVETTPVAEKRVPVRTSLTYIPDNSPLFPAIPKRTKPAEIRKEEYATAEIVKPAQATVKPKKSGWKAGFALTSLALVGAIFFSFAFFGSLGINSTVLVERGKPASVEFSQEKTFCFIFGNCQNGQN